MEWRKTRTNAGLIYGNAKKGWYDFFGRNYSQNGTVWSEFRANISSRWTRNERLLASPFVTNLVRFDCNVISRFTMLAPLRSFSGHRVNPKLGK